MKELHGGPNCAGASLSATFIARSRRGSGRVGGRGHAGSPDGERATARATRSSESAGSACRRAAGFRGAVPRGLRRDGPSHGRDRFPLRAVRRGKPNRGSRPPNGRRCGARGRLVPFGQGFHQRGHSYCGPAPGPSKVLRSVCCTGRRPASSSSRSRRPSFRSYRAIESSASFRCRATSRKRMGKRTS